ncbi:MAG TPA: hypothetical protein VKU36_00445, partial [Candidatus Babeliales bacterium]|nr:hypothetical protein [Candidatus Babeliales bacterium]
MSNLSVRAKAALLAFSIAASTSNVVCSQPSSTMISQMGNFITDNKAALALSTIVAALVAGEICLITDPRITYNYDNWTEDVKEFLGAYNLFDAQSRAAVKHFIKKY